MVPLSPCYGEQETLRLYSCSRLPSFLRTEALTLFSSARRTKSSLQLRCSTPPLQRKKITPRKKGESPGKKLATGEVEALKKGVPLLQTVPMLNTQNGNMASKDRARNAPRTMHSGRSAGHTGVRSARAMFSATPLADSRDSQRYDW